MLAKLLDFRDGFRDQLARLATRVSGGGWRLAELCDFLPAELAAGEHDDCRAARGMARCEYAALVDVRAELRIGEHLVQHRAQVGRALPLCHEALRDRSPLRARVAVMIHGRDDVAVLCEKCAKPAQR